MLEQALLIKLSNPLIAQTTTSHLRYEYQAYQNLFQAQPALVQQFLGVQAASLAEAVVEGRSQVRFTLPDQVVIQPLELEGKSTPVPAKYREQALGSFLNRLMHADLGTQIASRLLDLEQSANPAVSSSAILLRHALVMHFIHNILPVGNSVQYVAEYGDEIPCIPLNNKSLSDLTLTSKIDSGLFEEHQVKVGQVEGQMPFVGETRGFFLPQWVVFDDQHHLLVRDLNEAKAKIIAMKRYFFVLQTAVRLAPYMVTDEEYQRKRYGILGQLVNQGRALATYEVEEIIKKIKCRASSHELDRGLSLKLPYFNDQTLALAIYHFDIIPVGRVMFVPAFVVLAVRTQGAKVAQDTSLNKSTRRHLLIELSMLEVTFLR
jgi:hypothetical protein